MYLGKETTQNHTICIFNNFKSMVQYNVISLFEKPLHYVDYITLPTCAQDSLSHLSLTRSTYKLVLLIAWSHQLILTKKMIKHVNSFLILKKFFST